MNTITGQGMAAVLLLAACAKKKAAEGALRAGDMLVRLSLEPDPPRAGDNVLLVELMDAQGKPIDGAQLGFVYDMPAMGSMPEMKGGGDVKAMSGGKYQITYPLSMLGDWTLTLGIEARGHPPAELPLRVSPPRKRYSAESRGANAAPQGTASG